MISIKNIVRILINTAIGAILIFVWLRFVKLEEILKTISQVNPQILAAVFFFMFASVTIRSWRLRIFLLPIQKIPIKNLLFLNGVAMMLNFLIPIRAGEVAKGIYLHTQYGLPLGKSVIWVFLERLLDFLMVLIMASVLVLVLETKLPGNFASLLTLISAVAILMTYLMIFQVKFAKKMLRFLSGLLIVSSIKIYFEKIYTFFLESFSILKRSPLDLSKMALLTILAYGADAAIWYFTFLALGASQDYIRMFLGQLLSALTYLIPAAPGYVGSAEASGLLILSGIFGIEPNLASAMIVLFHITSTLYVVGFGIISVYGLKIDLGLVLRKALRKES